MAVSVAILEVIENDGLLGVTHSKVARKAGVSRAWIYEYIGSEKSALIEHAAEVFASHFARTKLDLPKTKAELEERLKEGVDFLLTSAEISPVVIKLYYRLRGTANPIGRVIQKYEKQWLMGATQTAIDVLNLPVEQAGLVAELLLTVRMGFAHRLATAGKADPAKERAQKTFEYVHTLVSAGL
jgi:AcrR family transcriptional regulator